MRDAAIMALDNLSVVLRKLVDTCYLHNMNAWYDLQAERFGWLCVCKFSYSTSILPIIKNKRTPFKFKRALHSSRKRVAVKCEIVADNPDYNEELSFRSLDIGWCGKDGGDGPLRQLECKNVFSFDCGTAEKKILVRMECTRLLKNLFGKR